MNIQTTARYILSIGTYGLSYSTFHTDNRQPVNFSLLTSAALYKDVFFCSNEQFRLLSVRWIVPDRTQISEKVRNFSTRGNFRERLFVLAAAL